MSGLTITQDDINKSKMVPPAWYVVDIIDAKEDVAGASSKNPGSTVYKFTGKIKDGDNAGVNLYWNFSEVAPGFAVEFIKACGREVVPGQSYDLIGTKGKTIQVHVVRGSYNGKPQNTVDGYRALAA